MISVQRDHIQLFLTISTQSFFFSINPLVGQQFGHACYKSQTNTQVRLNTNDDVWVMSRWPCDRVRAASSVPPGTFRHMLSISVHLKWPRLILTLSIYSSDIHNRCLFPRCESGTPLADHFTAEYLTNSDYSKTNAVKAKGVLVYFQKNIPTAIDKSNTVTFKKCCCWSIGWLVDLNSRF